jgi:hypothetical protein
MNRSSYPLVALAAVVAAACARTPAPSSADVAPTAPASAGALEPQAAPSPHGSASAADASAALAAVAPAASASAGPASEAPLVGADFLPEARALYRVAACGSTGDVPDRFDAAVVGKHCDDLSRAYADYKKSWVDVAEPFIAGLRPKDLPRVVVYPFGGGDLASALATYPDATEITTISLEPAGDARPIDELPPFMLQHELAVHRAHLERLFLKAHSRTENLEKESKTELPGEIVFDLAALVVHGDEPVGLRYFRVKPDGSIAYLTQADIDAVKRPSDRHALFADAELRFRKIGDPNAPVQVLRHMSFNLDDAHLKADPGLVAHLVAKGKVAAMTKAATHLLWDDHFSTIRGWLVDHTDWMISDSTGLPPRYATAAGFVQDTYGTFDGPSPFGAPGARDSNDLKKLFSSEPQRELAFRYGYPDKDGHAHLIVTRRASH